MTDIYVRSYRNCIDLIVPDVVIFAAGFICEKGFNKKFLFQEC